MSKLGELRDSLARLQPLLPLLPIPRRHRIPLLLALHLNLPLHHDKERALPRLFAQPYRQLCTLPDPLIDPTKIVRLGVASLYPERKRAGLGLVPLAIADVPGPVQRSGGLLGHRAEAVLQFAEARGGVLGHWFAAVLMQPGI